MQLKPFRADNAPSTAQPLSVSQLTRAVKDALESGFPSVTVAGEISNFFRHTSGHWYFTLKDAQAQLAAVMFRGSAVNVFFKPENGMEVICRGAVTVYEPRGQYQLLVTDMQPRGAGTLQLAFEQLKRRLFEEGLFDETRKQPLPAHPRCIALITSPTGAAVRDMVSVGRRRNPSVQLLLVPVQVQGAGAAEQIAGAVELCNNYNDTAPDLPIDVIIAGRGGGSIEDLWAFNEETVARAYDRSRIPVVSAVGHEIDFTIADFAADLRAATPSAAAELCAPSRTELLRDLQTVSAAMRKSVDSRMRDSRRRLAQLLGDRALGRPLARLRGATQTLDDLAGTMQRGAAIALERRRHTVDITAGLLSAHDPARVFRRGLVLALRGDTPLLSIDEVAQGDRISLLLRDGRLDTSVERIQPHVKEPD
jgi:exodeoxyribonuclease VII large subunit